MAAAPVTSRPPPSDHEEDTGKAGEPVCERKGAIPGNPGLEAHSRAVADGIPGRRSSFEGTP